MSVNVYVIFISVGNEEGRCRTPVFFILFLLRVRVRTISDVLPFLLFQMAKIVFTYTTLLIQTGRWLGFDG